MMINQNTKKGYEFPCGRWLAKDEDDHEIVRELPLSSVLAADKTGEKVTRKSIDSEMKTYKVPSVEWWCMHVVYWLIDTVIQCHN